MQNINIIGAGLVGSLWATYLAKHGLPISIYERRADMRKVDATGGRSINLALSNRGWRALTEVGLADNIRKMAIPMYGRQIHHLDGSTTFQPYGQEGQAIYSVSRALLNKVLLNKAASHSNVSIYFERKCQKIDFKKSEVTFLNTNNSAEETIKYDLLFGTDGAYSSVRSSMQRTERFDYSQQYLPHGYKELTIPPAANGGFLLEKNALHIWPRKSFMLIALPNLDGSFTCTLFLAYKGAISFEQLTIPEQVQNFFATYFADALPLIPNLLHDFFSNPTGSLVTIRCQPWIYNNQVALLGDASHAIVPFYGQGMNAGFEDCRVLHDCLLANQQHNGIDWMATLQDYDAKRKADADAIADLALRNFVEMRDHVASPRFLFRKQLEKTLQKQYPNDFTPVYSMVTFSHTPYQVARNLLKQQDDFFDKVLQWKDIRERCQNEQLQELIDLWKADFAKGAFFA